MSRAKTPIVVVMDFFRTHSMPEIEMAFGLVREEVRVRRVQQHEQLVREGERMVVKKRKRKKAVAPAPPVGTPVFPPAGLGEVGVGSPEPPKRTRTRTAKPPVDPPPAGLPGLGPATVGDGD